MGAAPVEKRRLRRLRFQSKNGGQSQRSIGEVTRQRMQTIQGLSGLQVSGVASVGGGGC